MAGLSRRDLLRLGAGAAALASPMGSVRAESTPRTIGISKVLDLTHTLSPKFPVIPIPGLTFPMKMSAIATLEKNGVYANKWELIEHNGTHIDAPCHFIARQPTLEQLPVQSLLAPAAVIDLSERARKDPDTMLSADDVLAWEKTHGKLPAGAVLFMYSGWDAKAGDPKAFLNMDRSDTMHFPGFAPKTCDFLVNERDVSGIGVDTISFDVGPDKEYKAHKALFRGGKWALECVADLGKIPPAGAHVFVGASKVEGASGGPARVVAVWS
jgi:kynurenine formamidase